MPQSGLALGVRAGAAGAVTTRTVATGADEAVGAAGAEADCGISLRPASSASLETAVADAAASRITEPSNIRPIAKLRIISHLAIVRTPQAGRATCRFPIPNR